MSEIAPVDEILNEIKKGLKEFGVEVLTITANGEPTLYPYFSELINSIKKIKYFAEAFNSFKRFQNRGKF